MSIEVRSPAALTTDEVHSLTEQMAEVARTIEAVNTPNLAVLVHERVQELSAWMRIRKAADSLRAQAMTLEVRAIRKIVQLGGADDLSATGRVLGRAVVKLSDTEFEAYLASLNALSLTAAYGAYCQRDAAARRLQAWERRVLAAQGEDAPEPDYIFEWDAFSAEGLRRSVADVLDKVSEETTEFTVAEAAEIVSRRLAGVSNSATWETEAAATALREVVREAIRVENNSPLNGRQSIGLRDGSEVQFPRFVTYSSRDAGYIRVPWKNATLAHLEAMAQERADQAEALARKAAQLAALLAALKASPAAAETDQLHLLAEALDPFCNETSDAA